MCVCVWCVCVCMCVCLLIRCYKQDDYLFSMCFHVDVQELESPQVLHKPLQDLTSWEHIQRKVSIMSLGRHLPKNMPADLRKEYNLQDPVMRFLSAGFLRNYICSFFEKWCCQNLNAIRTYFVETFMTTYVPYYGLEYFSAEKLAKEGKRSSLRLAHRAS